MSVTIGTGRGGHNQSNYVPDDLLQAIVLTAARRLLTEGQAVSVPRLRKLGVRGMNQRILRARDKLIAHGALPAEAAIVCPERLQRRPAPPLALPKRTRPRGLRDTCVRMYGRKRMQREYSRTLVKGV